MSVPTSCPPAASRLLTRTAVAGSAALMAVAALLLPLPAAAAPDEVGQPLRSALVTGELVTGDLASTTAHAVAAPSSAVADRVLSGGVLQPEESIAVGDVRLTMRADGDLVLTRGTAVVWRAATTVPGAHAVVTPEGDLRVVAGTDVLWTAGAVSPGARLVVKDHARIYLISTAGASVWSTPTPTAAKVPAVVTLPLPAPLPRPGLPGAGGGTRPDAGNGGERVHRTVLLDRPAYADPAADAAVAARAARTAGRTADAQLLEKAAAHGTARWLGPADGTARVRAYAQAAVAARATPVVVTYAIPDRDCGNHSAGGIATPAAYRAWVDAVAAGLAGSRAVVVVEPDALLHLDRCGERTERLDLLRYSVSAYTAVGAEVYLDGASSNSFGWSTRHLTDIAERLRAAGVDDAAGFAVNTSNFQTSAHEVAYGNHVSALLGGAAFVVDTSRNGKGPLAGANGTVWCNPEGRALGNRPRATGLGPHVADLWLKTPGRSDGTCNGGPAAGRFWESYLLGLATRASW